MIIDIKINVDTYSELNLVNLKVPCTTNCGCNPLRYGLACKNLVNSYSKSWVGLWILQFPPTGNVDRVDSYARYSDMNHKIAA